MIRIQIFGLNMQCFWLILSTQSFIYLFMNTALRPSRIDTDEEEEEDKMQYIEVKTTSEIKAILKAEKQIVQKQKIFKQNPVQQKEHKIVPQPITEQKAKKHTFIKDDREREYPNQKGQTKQKSANPNTQQTEKQKNNAKESVAQQQAIQNEKKAKKKKQNQNERKKYEQKDYSQQKQLTVKKQKYIEKREQRNEDNQIYQRQVQFKNGEQTEVQLIKAQKILDNQIFVSKWSVQELLVLSKKLLKQYEFIVLKAFGHNVSKAFLVAGILSQQISHLKQINIPRSVKVRQTSKRQQKIHTRGAVSIELSLEFLQKEHIGYQQAPNKPLSKINESRYIEKSQTNTQKPQRFKEKERDERALR